MTSDFLFGRFGLGARFRHGWREGTAHFEREFSQTFATGADAELTVENENGSVRILGRDLADMEVRVRARFPAQSETDADAAFAALKVAIRLDGARVEIKTPNLDQPSAFAGERIVVDYEVLVPRHTNVVVDLINGRTEVEGLTGSARVSCRNGSIRVDGAAEVELAAGKGSITAARIAGVAAIETENGGIGLSDFGASLGAKTRNGSIRYTGSVGGNITLETDIGGLRVTLPAASRFELDAEASMGTVLSDFDVKEDQPAGASVPRIKLRANIGSIRIVKT